MAVAAVFREEAGRLTAALVRLLGDFDLAEEVVQDSLVAALEKWPEQDIPDNPGAWLMTTARRRAIDILRRDKRYREKLALMERSRLASEPAEADDRLRLIFTCCHPALSHEARSLSRSTSSPVHHRRDSERVPVAGEDHRAADRARQEDRRGEALPTGSRSRRAGGSARGCSRSSTSCSTRAT